MKKETVKLIDFNNSTWELMRINMRDIGKFLSSRELTSEMPNLIALAVKLILSELVLNSNKYKKYLAKVYSDEEFLDMVIDSMINDPPAIEDIEASEDYIDKSRKVIWSHIKTYTQRLVDILYSLEDPEDQQGSITKEDADIFMECLTVVWVECTLRDRETRMLENTYGR